MNSKRDNREQVILTKLYNAINILRSNILKQCTTYDYPTAINLIVANPATINLTVANIAAIRLAAVNLAAISLALAKVSFISQVATNVTSINQ